MEPAERRNINNFLNIYNMKIVYCIDFIYTFGGVEIVTILKANALAKIPGNQVWLVVTDNKFSTITKQAQVSVIDLAVHYYQHDGEGFWHAVMDNIRMRKIHQKKLQEILNEIEPDIVISTGRLTKFFLPTLKIHSNPVFIREIHTAKHYKMQDARVWKEKLVAEVGEIYDYGWKIKRYDKIVVLTDAEKTGSWEHWNKVAVIPNPLTHVPKQASTLENKIVITAGRLVRTKNFSSLINAWAKVVERHPDWELQIWGVGDLQEQLKNQIKQMGLTESAHLMGYSTEILNEFSKASIFVSSSISEGFSLATLEAMSVGVPTVVYECPGGISHLVKNRVTGYLVPLNDEKALAERVCTLIEDEGLRRTMGQAALKESEKYKLDSIIQRWMALFQELLAEKRGTKK